MIAAGHQFIDTQGETRRLLMAIDGRVKLALLLAALGVNLTAGNIPTPLLLAGSAFGLVLCAGVPGRAFLLRMAVPAVLAAVAFATQLFWVEEGRRLLVFDLFSVEIAITAGGIERGLEVAARIVGGMGTLLFFSLTTPLPELMRSARFFRCPPVLVELTLIMYRYIFLLLEEGGRVRNAQRARLGYVGHRAGLKSSGILGGMLILRTFDRAERSFAAMRCRGYSGALTSVPPARLKGQDWALLAAGLMFLWVLFLLR